MKTCCRKKFLKGKVYHKRKKQTLMKTAMKLKKLDKVSECEEEDYDFVQIKESKDI